MRITPVNVVNQQPQQKVAFGKTEPVSSIIKDVAGTLEEGLKNPPVLLPEVQENIARAVADYIRYGQMI
ncbi:MAG: hypothetical protein PHC64_02925 [Candidatus Gastranaerophilales bacterium]|nr:hypothetical protein [Candidatus Gastranaerophilales bacterium]